MIHKRSLWAFLCLLLLPALSFAQQTGVVTGKVIGTDGLVLPGVTVEARAEALPAPRVTVTDGVGTYRLLAMPPGICNVTFELSGMAKVTKEVLVQLNQDTVLDVTMSVAGVTETVTVAGTIVPVIEKDSTAIKSGVSSETIRSLPVGQEYRDLLKLVPGVQYTQDSVRGQSAGGSGQDNIYRFDGVNVTLPLFGTLSTEPASYDIAQLTTLKGGAKAVDFERSAGFTVDTVSKSGTSRFSGQVSYQFQSAAMASDVKAGSLSKYDQNLNWFTANFGGPIWTNKLFFYGSYYRPGRNRQNVSNAYGSLPDYTSTRDEGFVKLTFAPISQILVNGTYRYSHRLDTGSTYCQTCASTTGVGNESWQKIGTLDGSWIVNGRSFLSFKWTHFGNPGASRPDNVSNVAISTNPGTQLPVNALDTAGYLNVPATIAGQDAYNAFVQPLINRYGYSSNGVMTGGGYNGFYPQFDHDDFYRTAWQVAYNLNLGTAFRHDIHLGYQYSDDWENLLRSSNGWGTITVPGGRSSYLGTPIYYQAAFQQQSIGAVPTIHSVYKTQNIEINDTMKWKNWSFNAGLLISRDRLYGQGLKNDSTALSGFTAAPGNQYLMYTIPFSKTLQPRLGATWAYNGKDTIYGSYAVYVPGGSSLPRAASWARNLATTINAYFDPNGVLFATQPVKGSSGKLFVADMTPRTTQEYLLGTSKQFNQKLSGRVYFRYRYSDHFWEDTNNNSRQLGNMPAGWAPATLYIPQLSDYLTQIGSGSSYVIAELDQAYTKYYEVTLESEYRTRKIYLRGSYTWSKYYGNFDQDASTAGSSNDANIFIGSSNIGDDAGHQLWDFRQGRLHGDRPHSFKMFGYYMLPWRASVGGFFMAQSGQPWEMTNYEIYYTYMFSKSTSDTSRYGEPAGSRRSPSWVQLDLNYTQDIPLKGRYKLQAVFDLYNVANSQTGYNYIQSIHNPLFNTPASYLSPRRTQISIRFQF
jgi:hypothetical protein